MRNGTWIWGELDGIPREKVNMVGRNPPCSIVLTSAGSGRIPRLSSEYLRLTCSFQMTFLDEFGEVGPCCAWLFALKSYAVCLSNNVTFSLARNLLTISFVYAFPVILLSYLSSSAHLIYCLSSIPKLSFQL